MASKEIILSISDVEAVLSSFEKKYNISSNKFMSDPAVREPMPEDDVFEWMAFIDHRNALQEMDQEMHREYLRKVSAPSDEDSNFPKALSKLALAA
jgi:hypothetical protein